MSASSIHIGPNNPYVGVGAGARDLYTPELTVAPADYQPGAKLALNNTEADWRRMHHVNEDPTTLHRVGGNIVNSMSHLSLVANVPTRFVGALGENDIASVAIREHLEASGIESHAVTMPGYQPSISIVRRVAGLPREISGLPRTPIREALSRQDLAKHLEVAGAVGASSLNDMLLNQWLLQDTPEGTPIFFNPGGTEYRKFGKSLINAMDKRVLDGKGAVALLALNETEMYELHDLDPTDVNVNRLRELAETATQGLGGIAVRILCTMDKAGFIIAENGGSQVYAADIVPEATDTTGAGDASNAAAQEGQIKGLDPDQTAVLVRNAGAKTVQHIGGTGHLDHLRRAA